MCLIVFKNDPAQHFSNKNFKAMIGRNGDGLGIMYRENGRVKVVKSIGNDNEKFALFREHRDRPSWAMHSRMKTHGKIDEQNCHPYKLLDIDDGDPIDLYMMHNGVLHNAPKIDATFSDTWHYCEYILKPIVKANPAIFWDNDHIHEMIQEHIGKANKFLFMRSDNHEYPVLILNSKSGVERNGMWLSNTYSLDSTRTTYHNNNNYAYNNYTHNNYMVQQAAKNQTPPSAQTLVEREAAAIKAKQDKADEEAHKALFNSNALTDAENTAFADMLKKEEEEALTRNPNSAIIMPLRNAGLITGPKLLSKPTHTIMMQDGTILEENKDDPLFMHKMELQILRAKSDSDLNQYLKDEPESVADMILALYDKCTMDFTTIVKQCKKSPDNIVRLIRDMTIKENYKKMLA